MEFKTEIETKVSGQTRFVVKNKDGAVKLDTGYNPNLLLDKFFTYYDWGSYIYGAVGTGTTPPLVTDVACTNEIGVRSARLFTEGTELTTGDETIGWTRTTQNKVFRWGLGDIVGNISEYALCTSTVGDNAIVKNLIKDGNGTPTTITVTADDQLEIWWKLSKHTPNKAALIAAETITNVELNGVSTDVRFTLINPEKYSTSLNMAIGPIGFTHITALKPSVIAVGAGYQEIYLANAGDTIVSSPVSSDVSTYMSGTATYDYTVPGVFKTTKVWTLPLQTDASTESTKFISFDNHGNAQIYGGGTAAILRFNPEFVRGPDKIFSCSISYTTTRA